MATQSSFDVTSTIDFQEVDNALNQARKEVGQRYDFKGATADIELNTTDKKLTLTADDEMKMNALWEIVQTRLVRRGVAVKNFKAGASEAATTFAACSPPAQCSSWCAHTRWQPASCWTSTIAPPAWNILPASAYIGRTLATRQALRHRDSPLRRREK